jgi:ubiquinone/menaquinone biosynthesis C-methylase UbiE
MNRDGQKINSEFWKQWWNSRSRGVSSDFELNRNYFPRDSEIERIWKEKLLISIDAKKSDVVLDAGCGSGENISAMWQKVNSINGLDYSEGMIDRCKRRLENESISNAKLMVGSITDIGLKENQFDKILCMSVLQYIDDEACLSALRELVRVSRDGALIVFHVKNLSSLYLSTLYAAKRIKKLFGRNVMIDHYRTYAWYKKELKKVGGQIVDYYSSNVLMFDLFPKYLVCKIRKIEAKLFMEKWNTKYGADLHLMVKINKH